MCFLSDEFSELYGNEVKCRHENIPICFILKYIGHLYANSLRNRLSRLQVIDRHTDDTHSIVITVVRFGRWQGMWGGGSLDHALRVVLRSGSRQYIHDPFSLIKPFSDRKLLPVIRSMVEQKLNRLIDLVERIRNRSFYEQ